MALHNSKSIFKNSKKSNDVVTAVCVMSLGATEINKKPGRNQFSKNLFFYKNLK